MRNVLMFIPTISVFLFTYLSLKHSTKSAALSCRCAATSTGAASTSCVGRKASTGRAGALSANSASVSHQTFRMCLYRLICVVDGCDLLCIATHGKEVTNAFTT